MEFFSSSYVYDNALLRRKRSVSRDRPSTGDNPPDKSSLRKRSFSVHTLSVSRGSTFSDTRPSLPTPVSAGISRLRGSAPAQPENARPPAQPASCDESSTPVIITNPIKQIYHPPAQLLPREQTSTSIPPTKPIKRTPLPPLSNLIVGVAKSTNLPSASDARNNHVENQPPSSRHPDAGSSSASRSDPWSAYVPAESHAISLEGTTPSAFAYHNSHPPIRSRSASASISTSKRTPQIEPATLSKRPDILGATPPVDVPPSSSKPSFPKAPTTLPTPISPHQSRSVTQMKPSINRFEHGRSRSQPHVPRSPISASGNVKSRRVPVPRTELDRPMSPPPSTLASRSRTSTPTHDAVAGQDKSFRNIIRNPSLIKREPTLASTSESERKSKTHGLRTRSGIFGALRRSASGGPSSLNRIASPIHVECRESRRDPSLTNSRANSRMSFGNSGPGKLVAVGMSEDELKNPWTLGWRTVRSLEDEDDGEKKMSLRRSLSIRLSERWNRKDSEHARPASVARGAFGGVKDSEHARPDSVARSAFGGVVDLPQEKSRRSAKRPTPIRKETKAHILPASEVNFRANHQRGSSQEAEGEGRVWEEEVGDWAFELPRNAHRIEGSDSSGPSRLWKLVKRLSSRSLKEKHCAPLEVVPPVPSLLKATPSAWRTDSNDGEAGPDPGSNVAEVSMGASLPTGTRRGPTPRSSSTSSENTKLFSRSRKSSFSSLGEAVPPMPRTQVVQHIIPPHELYRLDAHDKEDSPTACSPSPSARDFTEPESPVSSPSPSPYNASPTLMTIPKFEVWNPSNEFSLYKGLESQQFSAPHTPHLPHPESTSYGEQTLSPPPRAVSPRNSRRPSTLAASSLGLQVQQHTLPGVILIQESSESKATDVVVPQRPLSVNTFSTPKARPRSVSNGAIVLEPGRPPSAAGSIMTFREMPPMIQPLTEQEKMAKWEDLLQRSDMAGGTLHVGSRTAEDVALWNDAASLAPSETLDRF